MKRYVTTAEVAEALAVTPSAIGQRVRRGTLTPAQQLPGPRGAYLFDPDAIPELSEREPAE